MGFIDFLQEKEKQIDYAQEFKDAYMSGKPATCFDIVKEWQKNKGIDANRTYAVITIHAIADTVPDHELKELYEKVEGAPVENESLRTWFKDLAIDALNDKGIDV